MLVWNTFGLFLYTGAIYVYISMGNPDDRSSSKRREGSQSSCNVGHIGNRRAHVIWVGEYFLGVFKKRLKQLW
jgi:hypothetical protein